MHSLYPAFVRIVYHSLYGAHTMTLPTTPLTIDPLQVDQSTFDAWVGDPIIWTEMVDALLEDLIDFFPASVEFDTATVYTMSSPTAAPTPIDSYSLEFVGTNVTLGWSQATQQTFTFRTTAFGISKLTLLDVASAGSFPRVTDPSGNAAMLALIEEWTNPAKGWSGRDNARPNTFIQSSTTLNEKLRREYGLQ